jgi:hypothetical protein
MILILSCFLFPAEHDIIPSSNGEHIIFSQLTSISIEKKKNYHNAMYKILFRI